MTKPLIKIQFVCPETGEAFNTPAAAESSAKKAQNKAAKAIVQTAKRNAIHNSFRLELEGISDFGKLLNEKVKKHIGVDLEIKLTNIRFGQQSTSSSAPIGQKTNWCARDKNLPSTSLGWRGTISGKNAMKNGKRVCAGTLIGSFSFSDYQTAFGGFAGVHTGSGGGGMDSWAYECVVFLSDFPKLEKEYKEYLRVNALHVTYNSEASAARSLVVGQANEQECVRFLDSDICRMQEDIRSAQSRRSAAIQKYIEKNPIVLKNANVSAEHSRLARALVL